MNYDIENLKKINPEEKNEISDVAKDIFTPDKARDNRERNHFHFLKIVLIWVFGLLIISISCVVVYHLISPPNYRWLKEDEVAALEKMFITGIGAALIGKFGNKLVE